MLKFYYSPISPIARRVWLALLEKQIDFEPIVVNLSAGEQLKLEFLRLNPFHHIPVILDGETRVIESLAILDYLECKYPQISLLPSDPSKLARVKMAQMVNENELGSQVVPWAFGEENSRSQRYAAVHLKRVCKFMSELLAEDDFFGGEQFTVGDVVAGNGLILINKMGFDLEGFPNLANYCHRLMSRPAWQEVQPSDEELKKWMEVIREMLQKRDSSGN